MNYRKRLPWPRVKAELISKMTLMSPKILSDVYLSMFSFTPQNMTIHARGRDRLFFITSLSISLYVIEHSTNLLILD